jgi:transposase-like protein
VSDIGSLDRYLDQLEADDVADRRNGYDRRHLLTELGDIELNVPRTRRYSPVEVIRATQSAPKAMVARPGAVRGMTLLA